MIKNYALLNSNTALGFNQKSQGTITSGIDFNTSKTAWFFMVLVILSMATVQKVHANPITNFKNVLIYSSFTYHTVILKSSVDQGQSGGGGHGNADLVDRHPYDAAISKEYNNNNYILHTLFNPIL